MRTPSEAYRAAQALPNVPSNCRENFDVCAGLRPAPPWEIAAAAKDLTAGILSFLREHPAAHKPADGAGQHLLLGTIHDYLNTFDPDHFKSGW